jgi:hypothetical protein
LLFTEKKNFNENPPTKFVGGFVYKFITTTEASAIKMPTTLFLLIFSLNKMLAKIAEAIKFAP